MNVNRINEEYRINQQRTAVRILLGQKTDRSQRDMFIKSQSGMNDAGLYSPFTVKKSTYISDTLLLLINRDMSKVKKHGDVYEYEGYRFTADQIPEIDVKAKIIRWIFRMGRIYGAWNIRRIMYTE